MLMPSSAAAVLFWWPSVNSFSRRTSCGERPTPTGFAHGRLAKQVHPNLWPARAVQAHAGLQSNNLVSLDCPLLVCLGAAGPQVHQGSGGNSRAFHVEAHSRPVGGFGAGDRYALEGPIELDLRGVCRA